MLVAALIMRNFNHFHKLARSLQLGRHENKRRDGQGELALIGTRVIVMEGCVILKR